jgi:hypothetical protein
MDTPESMRDELGEWNNGAGIDLESWVSCEGRYSLAIGYATLFWPEFEEIDGYVLRKGASAKSIQGFEEQDGSTRKSVEAVQNHIHLADIQYRDCPDCTPDKLIILGHVLKEIFEAKLHWQFPDRPCTVEFIIPENTDDLDGFQITFWQNEHESPSA